MNGNRKNNAGGLLKRFIGNKNTVTLLGILACIATLIIGYNYRVKVAIDPISVPYAKQRIPTRTLITEDMIGKIKISKTYTTQATNLITDVRNVNGKYVSYKTSIPKNSLFYKEQLIEAEEMPDNAFANIEDGNTIFSLAVTEDDTYYNSIRAGDYIDLYMRASDPENGNKALYAQFVKSIRVLAVKDTKGNNIVKNRIENGRPAELIFSVSTENYELLMKSQYTNLKIKLEPMVRNANYTKQADDVQVDRAELQDLILERCSSLF